MEKAREAAPIKKVRDVYIPDPHINLLSITARTFRSEAMASRWLPVANSCGGRMPIRAVVASGNPSSKVKP